MRIIEVMPKFCIGGAEIMCENLCYELKKAGHEVIAVSCITERSAITDRLLKNGIDLRFLDQTKPGVNIETVCALRKILKAEKPDVLHCHLHIIHYCWLASMFLGIKCKVHTIHTVATYSTKKRGQLYNRAGYRLFGFIPVALSDKIKDTILQVYRIKPDKVPIIRNGINLKRCILKQNYDFGGKINIVHVGRFTEAKNHINMLRAIKKLHEVHPDIILHMYGEGELAENVRSFIKQNGMSEYALLHGATDNVYPALHDADIFILPSTREGMPMTVIEAMGTGLPVVASDVGGIPDMIEDGKEGLLCSPEPDNIAECIERFIADESLRETCGQNAKAASVRFSSKKMAEEYCKLFDVMIKH